MALRDVLSPLRRGWAIWPLCRQMADSAHAGDGTVPISTRCRHEMPSSSVVNSNSSAPPGGWIPPMSNALMMRLKWLGPSKTGKAAEVRELLDTGACVELIRCTPCLMWIYQEGRFPYPLRDEYLRALLHPMTPCRATRVFGERGMLHTTPNLFKNQMAGLYQKSTPLASNLYVLKMKILSWVNFFDQMG